MQDPGSLIISFEKLHTWHVEHTSQCNKQTSQITPQNQFNIQHKMWKKRVGTENRSFSQDITVLPFIIINPLNAGVVGAPHMICNQFSPFSPVLHCPLGLAGLQACPFPDVVFPLLPLSALSSSPFHCALQDGFDKTWWTANMTIPLPFASLYDGQEVFVWSNCLLDLGTDFLVGNMVFVWDV